MPETVLCSVKDRTAFLTLNRPKVHNAFNLELITSFTAYLKKINRDSNIRCVVIKASGEHFSSGADLQWMQESVKHTKKQNVADAEKLANMLWLLDQMPKPVVCELKGSVYGGAIGLIACADLVIARKDTTLCFPEVKLGLIPAIIAPFIIRNVGYGFFRTHMLTAVPFLATKALQVGLIHKIVTTDELRDTTNLAVKQCLQAAPQAFRDAKKILHDMYGIEPTKMKKLVNAIAIARTSNEAQQRLQSFLKRPKIK